MAEHTQNAIRDPRASLLVTEPVPDGADPLASGRVTLLGVLSTGGRRRPCRRAGPVPRGQPAAAYYIDFGDFTFYRLEVESIRYVGGYGRMSWVDAARYAAAEPDPLADAAAGIIDPHERRPRRGAGLVLSPPRRATRHDRGRDVGVDRYGFEMIAGSLRDAPPSVSASRRSAPPATRSARRWSPWSLTARARAVGGRHPTSGPRVRASSACARSARRSAAVSMPTDSRTRDGSTANGESSPTHGSCARDARSATRPLRATPRA